MFFGTKVAFLPPENPHRQAVFLSKSNSIFIGEQYSRYPPSNIDGFLSRDTCVSSSQVNRPIWNKMSISPL
jgi:hypothetical protein